MPRRRVSIKRDILPDPKYNSILVAQFVNVMMRSGKKSISQRILYDSFGIIEQKSNEDGLVVFRQAINNAKPLLEIRSRRVGGATYQIPVDVRPERRTTLAIRWLIQAAPIKLCLSAWPGKLSMRLISKGVPCGGRMSKLVWPKPIEPLRISVGEITGF